MWLISTYIEYALFYNIQHLTLNTRYKYICVLIICGKTFNEPWKTDKVSRSLLSLVLSQFDNNQTLLSGEAICNSAKLLTL